MRAMLNMLGVLAFGVALCITQLSHGQTSLPDDFVPVPPPQHVKRERRFDALDRAPSVFARHVSDEIKRRLWLDLGIADDATVAIADDLYLRYISPQRTLAIKQEQENYDWNRKVEEELCGPLIVLPAGTDARDLDREMQRKYFDQQQALAIGINRAQWDASVSREFALRSNEFSELRAKEARTLERAEREKFLAQLKERLPESCLARWDRAMRMLTINLDVVKEALPRAMIADPQKVDLHALLRIAAEPDGELHGVLDLPGLEVTAETAAQAEAIAELTAIIGGYEAAFSALLDVDPESVSRLQSESSEAFNIGDFDKSRAIEARLRVRSRPKYEAKIGTAKAVAEFLTAQRGRDIGERWRRRFNEVLYPVLFHADSVDAMHAWITLENRGLDEAQRAAMDDAFGTYVRDREALRERMMPLIIDVACDPNAMVSFATGEVRTAQSSLNKARGEHGRLAERTLTRLRALLDSETQKQFDAELEQARKSLQREPLQPTPP